jgi:hypothetical protein
LDCAAQTPSAKYANLIAPFAFNFGVEAFDMPTDPIFLFLYYMHHCAPVWAAGVEIGTEIGTEFARSQALLLMHAWALHTIGFAAHKKWLNKQTLFWPYMTLGFVLKLCWWQTYGGISFFSMVR